jgi:hypothetical protein
MTITIDGTTGITTPGLVNTGTESVVGLTTTGNTILGDASTDTLNVGNGGLVKDASGNVGIGTSSPSIFQGKLVVESDSSGSETVGLSVVNNAQTAGTAVGIGFSPNTNIDLARITAIRTTAGGLTDLMFKTYNGSTLGEKARIDASGNVGIGKSNPSTYLDSQGTVLAVGNAVNIATIQPRSDGPSGAGNGVSYGVSYVTNPINGARIWLGSAGPTGQQGIISFNTKGLNDDTTQPSERMRINSSGNIGVNTGANIYNTFHVNGGISVQSGPMYATSGAGLELWYNTALGVGEVIAYDRTNSVYKKLDISGTVVTATTEGVERLRIDATGTLILNQGQIKFPSTQVASANANTLDDYEEGTWTPVPSAGITFAGTASYSAYYTKIGRLVTANLVIYGQPTVHQWDSITLPFPIYGTTAGIANCLGGDIGNGSVAWASWSSNTLVFGTNKTIDVNGLHMVVVYHTAT